MTANRRPDPAAPTGEQSAQLIAQARHLDSRLRNATQTDRQLTRRAAGHLTQLARRLSVLLSRTTTALPMIPVSGGGRRLNHYVLHAERVVADAQGATAVRMLTIGSNGMLRTGSTDLHGSAFVWVEYDPFDVAPVWDVDTVLQWLADALKQLETQVEAVENRTRERSQSLSALVSTSKRSGSALEPHMPEPRAPQPFAAAPGARGEPARAAPTRDTTQRDESETPGSMPTTRTPLTPVTAAALSPLYESGTVDAMEELALLDEEGDDLMRDVMQSDPGEDSADDDGPEGEDAATRHRRTLFNRIR